jgi:hypothetical protein
MELASGDLVPALNVQATGFESARRTGAFVHLAAQFAAGLDLKCAASGGWRTIGLNEFDLKYLVVNCCMILYA